MTHLRKLMLEELERRNYAPSTTCAYLRTVDEFARYFNRPPDQLGPDHIRQYQAYLFRERKLEPNTKSAGCTAMHPLPALTEMLVFGPFEQVSVNWMITRVRTSKRLPPQVIIEIAGIELTHGFR